MKNSGGRWGGAITAALFLKEFVDCPSWAHLDIAGTAYAEHETAREARGATGAGVRVTHRVPRIALALIADRFAAPAAATAAQRRACAPPPPQQEENFTAIDSPSLQFLPRQQEAPGWQLEEDPIVVPGDRLTTYLDRDAAHFARYEALDVTAGKYSAHERQRLRHRRDLPLPRFREGVRRVLDAQEGHVQLPRRSRTSRSPSTHSMNIWRGPFYVRASSARRPRRQRCCAWPRSSPTACRPRPASRRSSTSSPDTTACRTASATPPTRASASRSSATRSRRTFNVDNDVIDGLSSPPRTSRPRRRSSTPTAPLHPQRQAARPDPEPRRGQLHRRGPLPRARGRVPHRPFRHRVQRLRRPAASDRSRHRRPTSGSSARSASSS